MKHLLLLLISLTTSSGLLAQFTIEWQKKLGGTKDEQKPSMIQTRDGGYILIGNSTSNDGDVSGHHGGELDDIWVVKTAPDGLIEWQKSYGGSETDHGFCIQQTRDGGYVFTGFTSSKDGDLISSPHYGYIDGWVVKLDPNGNIEWQKTFGYEDSDIAYSIQQTDAGDYVVGGNSGYSGDYWLFKLSPTGELLWNRFYGGSRTEYWGDMKLTSDQGFILTGSSYSNDGDVTGHHGSTNYLDYWVVKTDSMGILQWQKSLGGNLSEISGDVIETSEGGYLVSGFSNTTSDPLIVKLSSSGQIQWEKSLGGPSDDKVESMYPVNDGGAMLAGSVKSKVGEVPGGHHGYRDAWFLKISQNGSIEWQKLIGGSENDEVRAIIPTLDGGYAFCGLSISTDGDVTVAAHGSNPLGADYWLVKLNATTGTQVPAIESMLLYPNPTSGTVTFLMDADDPIIGASVSDLLGNQVVEKKTSPGFRSLDLSSLPAGIYFVYGEAQSGKRLQGKLTRQ